MKLSIFINRIFRNTFPVKFYYHFSLVNWTAATESAASYEHAHCAWYGLLIMTRLPRGFLDIDDLKTESSFHAQATNVIDVLGLIGDVIHGCLHY